MNDALASLTDAANLNVLRMALIHMTGDRALLSMKVNTVPLRGGAFEAAQLDPAHHDEVRRRALALAPRFAELAVAAPGDDLLREMMDSFLGRPVSDSEFRLGREQLCLEEYPREARWTAGRPEAADDLNVVIIGAGPSGIATAVQLQRLGIRYVVIERQNDVGGTWLVNHYPDARVDVNSFQYQFTFEKNYPWPDYFATAGDVRDYLEHVARTHGVLSHMRTGVELTRAEWDEDAQTWRLDLRDLATGAAERIETNVVVSGAGMFSTPKLPDIPGIDTFRGRHFHTTEWDDGWDPTGLRVAVIGNGSTGVQLMPRLAEKAERLYQFQRTPQWISPMEGYKDTISATDRTLLDTVPFYWNWFCLKYWAIGVSMEKAQVVDPEWVASGGLVSERNDGLRATLTEVIRQKLGHASELFDACVPEYAPLARRLVVDNGYYDAILRDNVELVTDGIARIDETGIVTVDGTHREVDAIVYAAGFQVTKYLYPTEYVGVGGITQEKAWEADGPRAYLSMVMPGFPNLFMLYGPNSQPRTGSFTNAIENWARYVAQVVALMAERGVRAVEVKPDVFEAYNERLDRDSDSIIWMTEAARTKGRNYYVNEHGRQTANTPWEISEYYGMLAEPDLDDYLLR